MRLAKNKDQKAKNKHRRTIYCIWICFLSLAFYLLALSCASAYTLSVGHLPPSRGGSTFLLITDLSGLGPTVEINFYDDVGREVSICRKLLPPNGKIQINVKNYIQVAGTIVLESSSDQIIGEYWQIQENGSMFMLPLQSPNEEKRYFVNCFRFQHCRSNLLVISDPYGSGPVVQMEFYSKRGELIKIAPKPIPPYGTIALELDEYAPWDVLGKVSIRSFRGGIVLHYRQLCANKEVLAIPARLPARTLLIDNFSIGMDMESDLVIIDASAKGPAIKIQFMNNNGDVLSSLEKLLPPNGVAVINPADYVDSVEDGIIQISSGSEIIADYWEKFAKAVRHKPAVNKAGRRLFISHFSPFDNTQNVLSLLNVGKESVRVEIEFYGDTGKKLNDKGLLLFLEPYRQIDELMDYHFDGVSLGTIIVEGPSTSLVVISRILDVSDGLSLGRADAQIIR